MTQPKERVRYEYARLFPRWKPSRAIACPRTVAGQACLFEPFLAGGEPGQCECRLPILDHVRVWHTGQGGYALTAAPSGQPLEALVELHAACAALGLRVRVTGESPYGGGTFLIVIEKEPTEG